MARNGGQYRGPCLLKGTSNASHFQMEPPLVSTEHKTSSVNFAEASNFGRLPKTLQRISIEKIPTRFLRWPNLGSDPNKAKCIVTHILISLIVIGVSACSTSQPTVSPSILEESAEIYEVVDVDKSPELIEGRNKLLDYIGYPESCRKREIEGDVTVQFIVDEHGNALEPSIQQGIGGSCDKAVIRAMAKRAKFTPGYLDGRAVKVRMSFTIYFRLR